MENRTLDQWAIPFGAWMDQAVDWIANNLRTTLDVIEWPFRTLINFVVRDFLADISWVWFVLGMIHRTRPKSSGSSSAWH